MIAAIKVKEVSSSIIMHVMVADLAEKLAAVCNNCVILYIPKAHTSLKGGLFFSPYILQFLLSALYAQHNKHGVCSMCSYVLLNIRI